MQTSEDSGVDNVESDQKIPNREQTLSKSESEDCDSYVSSTLVSASENGNNTQYLIRLANINAVVRRL